MSHYDHRVTAARWEPEAARIRAEAARQLDELRKAPDMPPVTDPASRLLARRLVKLREGEALSREQLALNLAGMNAATVGRIERCERAVSVPELAEFARVFGVDVADLIRSGALCEACGQELPQ